MVRCLGRRKVRESSEIHGGEMKETISIKKDAHKEMRRDSIVESKNRYKSMKNKAKIAISKAMGEKIQEALNDF